MEILQYAKYGQANFTALNIEPDDHSDDEVDNTKELQVRCSCDFEVGAF